MTQVWHVLFLACLPVAILLALTQQWFAAAAVFLIGTPLFWNLRNQSAARHVPGYANIGHAPYRTSSPGRSGRTAREAIAAEIPADETVVAECRASFQFTDGMRIAWPDVHIAVTQKRLVWTMLDAPEAGAIVMRLDQVVSHDDDGTQVMLTERDPDYAAMLHDPSNPMGEVDAVFRFEGDDPAATAVRQAIADGVARA
jgi:hypothetical protein